MLKIDGKGYAGSAGKMPMLEVPEKCRKYSGIQSAGNDEKCR
jgi:hypothetical protein